MGHLPLIFFVLPVSSKTFNSQLGSSCNYETDSSVFTKK